PLLSRSEDNVATAPGSVPCKARVLRREALALAVQEQCPSPSCNQYLFRRDLLPLARQDSCVASFSPERVVRHMRRRGAQIDDAHPRRGEAGHRYCASGAEHKI